MGHQSFFETEKSPQTRMNTKKNVPDSKIRHIIWWERVDSNHRSRNNRFTVCPIWPLWNSPICKGCLLNSPLFSLELVDGFEPPTCWLQISCSTSWATPASPWRSYIITHSILFVNTFFKKNLIFLKNFLRLLFPLKLSQFAILKKLWIIPLSEYFINSNSNWIR